LRTLLIDWIFGINASGVGGYASGTIGTKGSCTLEASLGIGKQENGDAVTVINSNNKSNNRFVTFRGIMKKRL